VEVDDVLADEVNLFGVVGLEEVGKRTRLAVFCCLAAVKVIFQ
jgi:hypothetical protein